MKKNQMRLMVVTFGIFAFLISIMGLSMGQGYKIQNHHKQAIHQIMAQ